MQRRADAEASFDADDPRGLRVVALLVVDRVVEPDPEPVDAAARRAAERNAEELIAGGILEALRVVRRAVEVRELCSSVTPLRSNKVKPELLLNGRVSLR